MWFELSERVCGGATWRVGAASYCLYEWVEPQDERADIDDCRHPHDDKLVPAERVRRSGRPAGATSDSGRTTTRVELCVEGALFVREGT